ncbi:molybdopterin oxidoreductase family protein [Alteromonas gracilis]
MAGATSTRLGVCNLCEAICGVRLTLTDTGEGHRVTGVRGNPDDPLSRGHICPKGTALPDVYDDPDRLRAPVKRVGDEFVEIGWDEAIALAADGLHGVQQRHGRDAVATYLGNPNVHSLGAMTHGPLLVKALGSRNVFSATSVDQLPQQLAAHLMFGHQLMVPIPDLDRTDLFVVLGGNPMASNGSLMTAPDFPGRLRELKARGGRMVVFDPRRSETAKVADEHHFVRPGTDALVLLAMLHVLFAEGLTTPPSWAVGVEAVRLAVRDFTPEAAATASGVDAETIRRTAREIAAADSAAVYGRIGVSTQAFGTVCHWAINAINLLTGNLDREGGAMFTSPAVDIVGRRVVSPGHFGRWRSRVRGLPEFSGELPVSALIEEIETPGEGQVRALITNAGNPVLSTPDGKRLGEAIEGLEFRVAIDFYVNETTRHADVILPPTSALERDHYDLVFHALAVRNTARFTPAVFDKPAGARHDWEIVRDLVLALRERQGAGGSLKRRLIERTRLTASPTTLLGGLLLAHRSGVTLRRLREHPEGIDLGPLRSQLPDRLQTRDRRVQAAPDVVLADLERLRREVVEPLDGELLLIGRRHQRDCNSWLHNTDRLTRGKARHHLLMHPEDLRERGLDDGTEVVVRSHVGTVTVEVRATDEVMRGVVSLPHGYGHAASGQRHAAALPGVSINDLTDPGLLDLSGNAALSGVPVTVSAG